DSLQCPRSQRLRWSIILRLTFRRSFHSSTRSLSSSHRIRASLPCTCSSPPGLALSSPMPPRPHWRGQSCSPTAVGECGRRYVLGPRVQGRCDGVDARICHCSPDVSKTRQITHDLRTRASLPRARRRGRPSLPGLHEGVYSLPLDPIQSRRLCVCAEVRNG